MNNQQLDSSIQLVSKKLQNDEFLVEFSKLLDHLADEYKEDFKDVKFKYRDSTQLREETIKQIIEELGFEYIRNLMDTLENIEFNVLIDFVSLVSLLKGSRRGLEIVLSLVGLETILVEWWENNPPKEEMTFDMTVIVTNENVPDIENTLEKVRIFVRHYVLPKLDLIEFRFLLGNFLERSIAIGGFVRRRTFGTIVGKI